MFSRNKHFIRGVILKKSIIKKKKIILAFSISLFFHLIFCFFNILPSSAPDELGTMSTAAKLVGFDWSYVLSRHNTYYGFGSAWFLAPLFLLVKDPLVIYFIFRVIIAIYLSIPTIIAYTILDKYFRIESSKVIFVGSVLCSFFSNISADSFINEAMLVLILWIEVYLLIVLVNSNEPRLFKKYSLYLGIVLSYSYTVHTRAVLYWIVLSLICIFYHVLIKRPLINYLYFFISFSSVIVMYLLTDIVQNTLFTSKTEQVISGSIEYLESGTANILAVLNKYKFKIFVESVLAMFSSNLFALIVFSLGLLSPLIVIFIVEVKQVLFDRAINVSTIITLYCGIGIGLSLVAISLLHVYHGAVLYSCYGPLKSDGRFYFYLRYYINYLPPLMLSLIYYFDKRKSEFKKYFIWSFGIFILAALLFIIFFIRPIINNGYTGFDVAGIFTSLNFRVWFSDFEWYDYFICYLLVIFFTFICYLLLKKQKTIIILCIAFILLYYEQGYRTFSLKVPLSNNAYECFDSTYKKLVKNEDFYEYIDAIYVKSSSVYKPECHIQLLFYDKKVQLYYGVNAEEKSVIISNSLINIPDAYYAQLDDNEYIYVSSKKQADIIQDMIEGLRFEKYTK